MGILKNSSDIKTLEELLNVLDLFTARILTKLPWGFWVFCFCLFSLLVWFRPFILLLEHLQLPCPSVDVQPNCMRLSLTDPQLHFPQPCLGEQLVVFMLFSQLLHQYNACQVVFQQQLNKAVLVSLLLLVLSPPVVTSVHVRPGQIERTRWSHKFRV